MVTAVRYSTGVVVLKLGLQLQPMPMAMSILILKPKLVPKGMLKLKVMPGLLMKVSRMAVVVLGQYC